MYTLPLQINTFTLRGQRSPCVYGFVPSFSCRKQNVVKWNLTQLTTRSIGIGQRSVQWFKHGQPCLHLQHVLSTAFPGNPSLHLAFGSFFTPVPAFYFFPLINQYDRSLVPLACGLMAGRCRFTSHWGITPKIVNFILKFKVKSWFSAFHRDSPEFGSFLSSDYVVCLVSGGKSGLDLYPFK